MSLTKTHTALHPARTSILTRAVRQYALFALCIVLTLSIISFLIARGALERRVLSQLSSVVAAKEDLIERSFQGNREHVVLLSSRAEVREVLMGRSGLVVL